MKKNRNSFLIVLVLSCLFYSCNNKNSLQSGTDTNIVLETSSKVQEDQGANNLVKKNLKSIEYFDLLPSSTTNQIIQHANYTLSYNEDYEQAEWVAYELKKSQMKNNHFKRPFFVTDPKVSTGSADWRNYKNSGYDKGHLCPAGDMSFDRNAYNDTFFTSNISPQNPKFNSGVWNRLEQKVRYWAVKYNSVYVITGGVLKKSLEHIGSEKVAVPNYFYKVLLVNYGKQTKMIAFLVPNKPSENPLYDFVVSVDRIEEITGIDFFPKLDDAIEDKLESTTDYKSWSFN